MQYVYDLRLPPPSQDGAAEMGAVPTTNPADGEVESFELMSLEDVVEKMVAGEFKPNCALCVPLSHALSSEASQFCSLTATPYAQCPP